MDERNTFEENFARLEQIIRELEQGDVALEKSLSLFEEGIQLVRRCSRQLDAAEARIAKLVVDEEGEPRIVPFSLEADDEEI
ncbi:MAG TPA: exodeoxyribonuclease VII small subunit [Firmicutes bacterium]|nr:exodeoxyribonuclease VII small subunit [Bacillota bacterium]